MVRKMVSLLAVGVAGLLAFGGVANAQPAVAYPPTTPPIVVNVTVNITIINIGGTVIFTGGGFDPGELIDIAVSYAAPGGLRSSPALAEQAATKRSSTTADAAGSFTSDVPLTQIGTATITATGLTSGHTASLTVEVLSAESPIPAGTTGSSSSNTYTAGDGGGNTYAAGSSESSPALASTGASIVGPIAIGAAALLAGLALLFFGTRGAIRRRSERVS